MKNMLVFVIAAFLEIDGCFAFWACAPAAWIFKPAQVSSMMVAPHVQPGDRSAFQLPVGHVHVNRQPVQDALYGRETYGCLTDMVRPPILVLVAL